MNINAIVVAYESDDLIRGCVQAALESGVSRVLIWDNDSAGTVAHKLEGFNPDRVSYYTDGHNWGFGGGVNRAISYADKDATYLLINPDCYVTADAVGALSAEAGDERVGVVAPRMHYLDNTAGISGGPYPTLRKELGSLYGIDQYMPAVLRRWVLSRLGGSSGGSYQASLLPGATIDMDWVSGFCFLINPTAFHAVGGFDERFFLYFEDVDFCRRVTRAGYKVRLVRQLSVLHLESTSTSANGKSHHYKSAMRTYFKVHGSLIQRALSVLGGP